jgi:hypothetical protein
MKWRSQSLRNDEPGKSRADLRQALMFWLFWSAYVLLAALLIAALLTDWPGFLHEPTLW